MRWKFLSVLGLVVCAIAPARGELGDETVASVDTYEKCATIMAQHYATGRMSPISSQKLLQRRACRHSPSSRTADPGDNSVMHLTDAQLQAVVNWMNDGEIGPSPILSLLRNVDTFTVANTLPNFQTQFFGLRLH